MWIRPKRYLYIGRKYWRKNRLKLWWVGHVKDEIYCDWLHRNGSPCKLAKEGQCLFCP